MRYGGLTATDIRQIEHSLVCNEDVSPWGRELAAIFRIRLCADILLPKSVNIFTLTAVSFMMKPPTKKREQFQHSLYSLEVVQSLLPSPIQLYSYLHTSEDWFLATFEVNA